MSEEENEQPEVNMFYMQLPPEIQEQLDHQHMIHMQNAHDGVDFFDGLSETQLKVFRGLLNSMRGNEAAVINYYMGLVSGLLSTKFGVCIACSVKHDEELKDMAGEGPVEPKRTIAEEDALLEEYGLQRIPGTVHLQCKNCHVYYPSLDDRMLKPPGKEGCDSCVQKEKWG